MRYINQLVNETDVVVISYDAPHRKTHDVLNGLHDLGYVNVTVLALPFKVRENPFKPIYSHRPPALSDETPQSMCTRYKYRFRKAEATQIGSYLTQRKPDFTLIAGAGLLPDALVEQHKIINSHPGWLPYVRGLDSLKWAIHKKLPIGVTTHFIDATADAGKLIEQRLVPIYPEDKFEDVANRQYELEIDMLIHSITQIKDRWLFPQLSTTKSEPTKRMPKNIEQNLMKDFEDYKTDYFKKQK